jgi:hypothetical protein
VGSDCLNLFLLLKSNFQRMDVQQRRVLCSGVPAISNIPTTQLTPLEEVINRVKSAVEITTREFEYLTSWLFHRGERKRRERQGFSRIRRGDSNQNFATEGHRMLPEAGGKLALEIQVGKKSRSNNLIGSKVTHVTIQPTVLTHLLLAHHAVAGQPAWRVTKQNVVCKIKRGKAKT